MKFRLLICRVFLAVFFLSFLFNCKKETNKTVPTVTIADVTNITASMAHSGGDITSDGGTTVTSRGVCWSINQSPTISDGITSNGSGKGTFTSSLIGLTPGTTYNIKAYATNSEGTAYSGQVSFITLALAPVLTTTDLSAITSTTATSGGTITNDGGSPVTSRGVCWSTTSAPTIVGSKTSDGTGSGSFTSAITGLTPGAIYYVRAYATNSIGTAYGNEKIAAATAILPVLTTTAISSLTSTTATSGGNISNDGGAAVTARGLCWSTSANPTTSNSKIADTAGGSGSFTSAISGFIPGMTYYLRAYATNSIGTAYGNEVTVIATAILPVLTTTAISSLTSTTATSGGNITSDGGAAVTARGVCWSTSANPTIVSSKTSDGTGSGSFTSAITGLTSGATYYVRAYATNSIGTSYGNQITATATMILPVLTTTAISALTSTTATSGGNITSDGGAAVMARGVCWSTSENPTTANSKIADASGGSGSFTSAITGLTPGVIYYIRAYATNSLGTAYGNQITATASAILPVLTTAVISTLTSATATSGGNITSDGGAAVTARGVCWSTSTNPTIASSKTSDGTGSGSFTSAITGLTSGATYYVRAYATNSIGTAYGNQITATATTILPVLTTTAISALTSTTATSGGNITSDGGSAVTARGVCWSTSANPTTASSKIADTAGGSGNFTSAITGLIPGTTYYIRAYATNSLGTAYGNQITATATAILPVLTTTAISALTSTTATSGGNITSDGGAAVTARGVCWSTSANPTTASSKIADAAGGSGSFTSSITGLTPGATYYIRAYATNSIGTAYGNQITATATAILPVLTTTAISALTSTTATSGGNITSDGGAAVTARGVCWSTSANPTTASSKITDVAGGSGSFTSSITGLTPGATYYIRAYATNSIGTAYGNQITATVPAVIPVLTTTVASAITSTTATSGGNITSDGGSAVTVRGVCWGVSASPTIALSTKTSDGTATGTFTSSITGLTTGTIYHIRAYATNSIGTAYGNDLSFTTTSMPTLTTTAVTLITATTAASGGNITRDGGAAVTARGVCWSTSANPTIAGSKTTDGTGTGSFVTNLTGLTPNTTYYTRAYATNSVGTSYGNELRFKTFAVLDIDGNGYYSVLIGTQTWLTENLKTTKYNNGDIIGTTIPATLDITGETTPKYQWAFDGNEANVTTYGRLYTWYAVTDSRKVCPTGWHVPSDNEWTVLTNYLINNGYGYQGSGDDIAKSMAATSGWSGANPEGTTAYDLASNNSSGFTALPGGYRFFNGTFYYSGSFGYWWSASVNIDPYAWIRNMVCNSSTVLRDGTNSSMRNGYSVRCVHD